MKQSSQKQIPHPVDFDMSSKKSPASRHLVRIGDKVFDIKESSAGRAVLKGVYSYGPLAEDLAGKSTQEMLKVFRELGKHGEIPPSKLIVMTGMVSQLPKSFKCSKSTIAEGAPNPRQRARQPSAQESCIKIFRDLAKHGELIALQVTAVIAELPKSFKSSKSSGLPEHVRNTGG